MSTPETRAGIPDCALPGPFPVGDYAAGLRRRLREFARVQIVGELTGLRPPTRMRVYFELRDAHGAVPCAMWRNDWERLGTLTDGLVDGTEVVVAGGCDYYPGSATSSPSFSFSVTDLRIAGEGDLLARIERLRRALDSDGLLDPQKHLPRPSLPRTIGVVTGETGKARDDVLAGLRRRGWAGRLVWAFAPVQDRHAAPRLTAAVQALAMRGDVDVIVVARGGGSLVDLMAFCDETLCRTVAMLPVPVIASVGHHTDRTVLDDVAAVSCSTPTHAAEVAVPLEIGAERSRLARATERVGHGGRRAVVARARVLAALSRVPGDHLGRQRAGLHQHLREMRAASRRRVGDERHVAARRALVLQRKAAAAAVDARERRPPELHRLGLALGAHDPELTLARGYALVEGAGGQPVASAGEARRAGRVALRFADGRVPVRVEETDG